MDVHEVERRNLVVAIWDKDSKSRDDFMAGGRHLVNIILFLYKNVSFMQIRIRLRDVKMFEKREVFVNLLSQDENGHVGHAMLPQIFSDKS